MPASLIGLPALCVPAGFGPRGKPIGLQFIGALRADAAVLGLGHAYCEATDFHHRRPPEQQDGDLGDGAKEGN